MPKAIKETPFWCIPKSRTGPRVGVVVPKSWVGVPFFKTLIYQSWYWYQSVTNFIAISCLFDHLITFIAGWSNILAGPNTYSSSNWTLNGFGPYKETSPAAWHKSINWKRNEYTFFLDLLLGSYVTSSVRQSVCLSVRNKSSHTSCH